MAAGTARVEYAANAVYGSLAYDLNTAGGYAIPQEAPYAPPAELPRETTRERTRERVRTRTKEQTAYGVPVLGIVGIAFAALLMVFVLFGYVQLAEISSETTRLKNTITELNNESAKLRVTYESTFNLNEIESYAINVLGMTKLSEDNVVVFGAEKADKAEILGEDDSLKSFLSQAADFVNSLVEYFS